MNWYYLYCIVQSEILTHNQWIPFSCSNRLTFQAMMGLTCTQKQLSTATPMSSFVQYWNFIMVTAFFITHIFHTSKTQLITMSLAEWNDTIFTTEGFFRSSYKRLPYMGFEPTCTEFCSNALTEWVRPWVQLSLRAKLVQLLQTASPLVQSLDFVLTTAFVSRHNYHNWSLTHTTSEEQIYIYCHIRIKKL